MHNSYGLKHTKCVKIHEFIVILKTKISVIFEYAREPHCLENYSLLYRETPTCYFENQSNQRKEASVYPDFPWVIKYLMKGEIFIEEFQLINEDSMLKLEYHYFAAQTEIMQLGNDYQ